MLSATRLIGHKEWTGRKSDPRHDMNWRRARVASFVPRQGTAHAQEDDMPLNDDDKGFIRDTVLHIVRAEGISGNAHVAAANSGRIVETLTEPIASVLDASVKIAPRDMLALVDGHAFRTAHEVTALNQTVRTLVEALAGQARGDDIDVDALLERIGERVDAAVSDAAKLIKVQVSVDDADTDAPAG